MRLRRRKYSGHPIVNDDKVLQFIRLDVMNGEKLPEPVVVVSAAQIVRLVDDFIYGGGDWTEIREKFVDAWERSLL